MSKARHFSRTPTPKLQPRVSVSAERVRQTNISISIAQRKLLQQQHRQRDNGHKDDYWHRQVGKTPQRLPLPVPVPLPLPVPVPAIAAAPNCNDLKPLRRRFRFKATALPLLVAIFVCLLFIDFIHRDNTYYDPRQPTQQQWLDSFKNQHGDNDGIYNYHETHPEKPSIGESLTDAVANGMQRKDTTLGAGIGTSSADGGLLPRREVTDFSRSISLDTDTHHLRQTLGGAENSIPILDHTTTQHLPVSLRQHDPTKKVYHSHYSQLQKDDASRLRYSPGIPLPNQHVQEKIDFLGKGMKKKKFRPTKQLLNQVETAPHTISGLHCLLYGGPSHMACQDLVYWKDIPSDSEYTSPFYYSKEQHRGVNIIDDDITANQRPYLRGNEINRDSSNKYLIFEPDNTSWSNHRIAFETVLALSAAMGRTLVLPPRQGLPLLSEGSQSDRMLSYDDFFHLDSLNKEYEGIHIITIEEFLLREGSSGNLYKYGTSDRAYVPYNRTSWDDLAADGVLGPTPLSSLWDFIRSVSYTVESWDPNECIAAFPATAAPEGNVGLSDLMRDILLEKDRRPKPQHFDFQGRPIPANAATIERMREMMAGRSKLCLYDDEMQSAAVIHFPYLGPESKSQLHTHFYSFLFFEQWQQAMWTNRLIRDHIRYRDEIVCAAARVAEAIRKHSANGFYDSMHIRRNNSKKSKLPNISEDEIFYSLSEVESGSTIFVASDEKGEVFFTRLHERYDLVFLNDYTDLLSGINVNYYGMVEQIVASRGVQFFGTFSSTFSAYVSRLRGYYAERDSLPGYDEGKLSNTYFMPRIYRNELKIYQAIQQPFFAREFPIAWKDADKGVGEMIWKG